MDDKKQNLLTKQAGEPIFDKLGRVIGFTGLGNPREKSTQAPDKTKKRKYTAQYVLEDPESTNTVYKTFQRLIEPQQQEIVSPVPEIDTLNEDWKMRFVKDQQMREQAARQTDEAPDDPQGFEYPEWMANAPTARRGSQESQEPVREVSQAPNIAQSIESTIKNAPADWGQFVEKAKQVAEETGFPLAVILGQAAIETGRRSSPGNNYFGIKGQGTAGTQNLATQEATPEGQFYGTRSNFAAYKDPEDSIRAYVDLIKNRYKSAWDLRSDPQAMIRAIHQGGYATDPSYVQKVTNTPEFRTYAIASPKQAPQPIQASVRQSPVRPAFTPTPTPRQSAQTRSNIIAPIPASSMLAPPRASKPQPNIFESVLGGVKKFFGF